MKTLNVFSATLQNTLDLTLIESKMISLSPKYGFRAVKQRLKGVGGLDLGFKLQVW